MVCFFGAARSRRGPKRAPAARQEPSPLSIRSSVLALSAFRAATAFMSMALASSAVPWSAAKAVAESARTAPDATAIMNVRIMGFLPRTLVAATRERSNTGTGGTRVKVSLCLSSMCLPMGISAAKFKTTVTSVCRRFCAAVRQAMRFDRPRNATLGCGHCRSKCWCQTC